MNESREQIIINQVAANCATRIAQLEAEKAILQIDYQLLLQKNEELKKQISKGEE